MDQQPSPPSVDVLILSPASLANYANCMERGFMELASGSTITSEHRPSCRSIIAREGDAAAAVALAASQPCGTLLVQLHGAHTEEPVAFMIEAHIRQQQHQQQRPRLVVLLHRPEEILERARRGLYASAASSTDYGGSLLNSLIRHADAVVLLGEAMREVYASLPGCRRCVAIPHGFFGLLSERDLVQSASTAASSDDSPSIVVGSITTWSDMRWVSDILRMHQAYLEARARAPSTLCGGVLFYVAGTYRAYERPDGTRIDELALLQARSSSLALELVDGHEIDALALERGSGTFSSNELRSWLWQRSGHGARVIVVRSGVRDATALAAQARVCDVNVQLYRELLNDFAPKVHEMKNEREVDSDAWMDGLMDGWMVG